jgi:hypothetical protein
VKNEEKMNPKINLKENLASRTKRIFILFLAGSLLLPAPYLKAEDYPTAYLGSGYREYLYDKLHEGFYLETFSQIDLRQKERVNKRSQVEQILSSSYQAMPQASENILITDLSHKYSADNIRAEVAKYNQQRTQAASAQGAFTYVPYSDGKIEYFKDGLVDHIVNERVVDEFGNVNIKNTYNMQYNGQRMITSYEADVKDNLGNLSRLSWYGAEYTPDSVSYGGSETNANKNLKEYYLKEIDHAGNVKITHFKALGFEGKFLRAFNQRVEDSIYGTVELTRSNINYEGGSPSRISSYHEEGIGADKLTYALDRYDINYNDGQMTGYREVMFNTLIDGNKSKITTEAKFDYGSGTALFGKDVEADPGRILSSSIATSEENPDGSLKTETASTYYYYDANNRLVDAAAHAEFNGKDAPAFRYTDAAGHELSRYVNEAGVVTYSYVSDSNTVVAVPATEVTSALCDGSKFSGKSETKFEIRFGKPLSLQTHSLASYTNPDSKDVYMTEGSTTTYANGLANNILRVLSTTSTIETVRPLLDPDKSHSQKQTITTQYVYDAKGNLMDAAAQGVKEGYEYTSSKGFTSPYAGTITINYDVALGKTIIKTGDETKTSKNTPDSTSKITVQSTETSHTEYQYDEHFVAISSTEKTTAKTIITDKDKKEATTTESVSTNKNIWKAGGLKLDSSVQTATTTSIDGSSSKNTSTLTYLHNNLGQLVGASGKTETTEDNGKDAAGQASGSSTSTVIDNYIIKNGQALKISSKATGTTYGPAEGSGKTATSAFTLTSIYKYTLLGGNWEIASEINASVYNYTNGGSQTITKEKTYNRNAKGACAGITQTAKGDYSQTTGEGGKLSFKMENYKANFVQSPDQGWYLKDEKYDWNFVK